MPTVQHAELFGRESAYNNVIRAPTYDAFFASLLLALAVRMVFIVQHQSTVFSLQPTSADTGPARSVTNPKTRTVERCIPVMKGWQGVGGTTIEQLERPYPVRLINHEWYGAHHCSL